LSPRPSRPRLGEIFGDEVVATAVIDWLMHHSEIVSLKADSYRLPGEDLDARPHDAPTNGAPLGRPA
jgi:IstB-like ATP binding protein